MSRRLYNRLTSRFFANSFRSAKMSSASSSGKWKLASVTTHVDKLVAAILNWRKQPKEVLLSVLQELKEATESDDAVGQLCREKSVDAIKELVAMIRSAVSKCPSVDEEVVPAVLACLRYVTKGVSKNIELATSQGACTAARDVMCKFPHNAQVQINTFLVFRSLTFNRGDNQRLVVVLRVLQHTLDTLRYFRDNPEVLAAGFMLLQNVTWLVEENRNVVEEVGAMQVMFDALALHPDNVEVAKWTCGALQNLACNVQNTPGQIRLGVIPVVLRALTAHRYDPVVQAYGLGVLRNLSFLEANRIVVGQSGALELAVAALCAHLANADVVSSAVAFLFNVVIDVEANATRLLGPHMATLRELFSARAMHRKDAQLYDKINAVVDQIAHLRRTPDHVVVQPADVIEPFPLFELAVRQVAALPRDVRKAIIPELMDELRDPLGRTVQCSGCSGWCVRHYDVAIKPVNSKWELLRACSSRCSASLLKPLQTTATVAPSAAVPHAAG